MTDQEKEKDKFFEYIDKHINLCTFEERTAILTKIMARLGKTCVQETSDGSNIFLNDIPIELVREIKDFIHDGNAKNRIDFSDIGVSPSDLLKIIKQTK